MKNVKKWTAHTKEDGLLKSYWKQKGGCILAEVPIGGPGGPGRWPKNCERRRIDGVRIVSQSLPKEIYRYGEARDYLQRAIDENAFIELIEVKQKLNRLVIGQILAGQNMFKREYKVRSKRLTIVCARTDGGLEWVCSNRGITVCCIPTQNERKPIV